MVNRGEVYLVNSDPTIGSEVKKTRPCMVVSPDEMNKYIRTIIIAPMTTRRRNYKRGKQNYTRKSRSLFFSVSWVCWIRKWQLRLLRMIVVVSCRHLKELMS